GIRDKLVTGVQTCALPIFIPRMYVEVESNPNYGNSVFLRFRELGPARPVGQVRVYDRVSTGEWCRVTGWQNEASAPLCRAVAQRSEERRVGKECGTRWWQE